MKPTLFILALVAGSACGDDADGLGVGATCSATADCGEQMVCLDQFSGGACGMTGCSADAECPEPGVCVVLDGVSLCLRSCQEKTECNANRSAESEANCSANVTRAEGGSTKACVPPSGT
jgi:hypothetical protein